MVSANSFAIAPVNALNTRAAQNAGTWSQVDGKPGVEVYSITYTLGEAGGSWSKTLDEPFPAYTSDGESSYYYWVEEVVPTGYEASYKFIDNDNSQEYVISAKDGNGKVQIINTKMENSGVQMSSTGGMGTRPYQAVGITLIGITIPALMIKTRRRRNEK